MYKLQQKASKPRKSRLFNQQGTYASGKRWRYYLYYHRADTYGRTRTPALDTRLGVAAQQSARGRVLFRIAPVYARTYRRGCTSPLPGAGVVAALSGFLLSRSR